MELTFPVIEPYFIDGQSSSAEWIDIDLLLLQTNLSKIKICFADSSITTPLIRVAVAALIFEMLRFADRNFYCYCNQITILQH